MKCQVFGWSMQQQHRGRFMSRPVLKEPTHTHAHLSPSTYHMFRTGSLTNTSYHIHEKITESEILLVPRISGKGTT